MYRDFKELLAAFNAHGVRYLIVGGYAVSFHAQPRVTKDIDLLVKPDAENAEAIYAALTHFGAPLGRIAPKDLVERGTFFRMGREPVAGSQPGVNWLESLHYCADFSNRRTWSRMSIRRNSPASSSETSVPNRWA
jgi:hypothetical protein